MFGIELAVGYLVAWGVRKLRRIGERVDGEVDDVLDTALDRLHDAVAGKLGGDPALARLEEAPGEVSDRTRRRVGDALAEAAEGDADFRAALTAAVEAVAAAEKKAGADLAGQVTVTASGDRSVAAQTISGAVVTGDQGYVQR